MENPDSIAPIIQIIKPFNPIDLLAKVGALQLCPENANHAIRFEALAHAINCSQFEPNKPICTRHRLDHIFNNPPLGNGPIQSQEDPTPNAFTEAFTFFGGSYIVFPGQLTEPTFILKHLNAAIFLGGGFKAHKEFRNKVLGLNHSILVVSNTIATRAGFVRNMTISSLSRRVFIPSNIDTFKNLVVFSNQEIEENLDQIGLDLSALERFIQPFGQLTTGSYTFQNSPLHSRPIIRFEDDLIIAEPWMLLAALRHLILLTAKEFGVLDILLEEYQKAILNTVGSSLKRFGHSQIPQDLPDADLKFKI